MARRPKPATWFAKLRWSSGEILGTTIGDHPTLPQPYVVVALTSSVLRSFHSSHSASDWSPRDEPHIDYGHDYGSLYLHRACIVYSYSVRSTTVRIQQFYLLLMILLCTSLCDSTSSCCRTCV
jgi:hypothetical protein